LTLTAQRPGWRLTSGINTSGQLFVDETNLSGFGKQVQLFGDFFYQLSPRVTITAADYLSYDRNTAGLTSGGVSVGFEQALRNTFTSSVRLQATPNTGLSITGSQTLIHFSNPSNGAEDSNTYRLGLGMDHRLTQRLAGGLSLGVAYIDFQHEAPVWTFTPTVSLAYDITRTLRAYINVGPTILTQNGSTTVLSEPTIGAGLQQTFKWGSVSIGYDRAVTAETIGAADRQSIFGSVQATTFLRGLTVGFTPSYNIVDTNITGLKSTGAPDTVKTLTLTLNASYQIARSISVVGSYTFFRQTSNNSSVGDIDQNTVFLGLQYAFPITIY